jgi:hypothetical protein
MNQDDSTQDPNRPPPLDYRAREADQIEVSVRQAAGGCVLACAILFAAFLVGIAMAARGAIGAPVLLVAIAAIVVVGLAVQSQRNPARRGLAIGIWIGLGVALLIDGICFIGVIR